MAVNKSGVKMGLINQLNFEEKRLGSSKKGWQWRNFSWVILLFTLPNAVMYLAAHFQALDRPWVNVDYVLVLLCIVLGSRFLAGITLFVVFFFDVLGLVGQFIPILRLSDVFYISSFIGLAPLSYQLLAAGVVGLLLLFLFLYLKKSNKQMKAELLLCINLVVGAYMYSALSTGSDAGQVWRGRADVSIGSQTVFAFNSRKTAFVESLYAEGDLFSEIPARGASSQWFGPAPQLDNKILLVVNESWGVIDEDAQGAILEPILKLKSHIDNLEQGTVEFRGLTVEAEIRELCQRDLLHFNFEEHETELSGCLPNVLRQKGYKTFAFHGASGLMYDRVRWYPDIGFQNLTFFESEPWPRRCFSFPGACDSDMADYVAQSFSGEPKVFSYWLTLNSHHSYDERDIHDEVIDCRVFGIDEASETCRNLSLQKQFFKELSEIVRLPEMAGVTVLVVGDHEPPIKDKAEKAKHFREGRVPWIRFEIPENDGFYTVNYSEFSSD